MRALTLALFTLMYMETSAQRQTDWDRPLNFQCSSTANGISYVISVHDKRKKERRFLFVCRPVHAVSGSVSCHLSGYVNSYDQPFLFTCPNGGYLNSVSDVHNNSEKDRLYRFRCCTPSSGYYHTDCTWTGWVNNWSEYFTYFTPRNYIIKGVHSIHNKRKKDRRFQFEICRITPH
ncbi:hemagglutinin/amebocyte aggregation factor-like [Ostrea edulis]|uniref:hemagglutinin/amebocyte aggregation factor-like n=1 Tax=Ostrea edulis TaxID=37623 RepID=UPI0024AF63B7|nr:hemagglutinin/amebocyte aggregation factor-like [Ostrea edulis]